MSAIGLYISTTRADYHLAKALISSIKHHAPGARIVVLPDDNFHETLFCGQAIWRPSDPRVLSLDGFYKKLRVFWGPFERFMLFDADQLVVRPLEPLLQVISGLSCPFLAANQNSRLFRQWNSDGYLQRLRLFEERAGRPDLIEQFDSLYHWSDRYPLNSGEIAASRDAIDHDQFLDVFERASQFHSTRHPDDPLIRSRTALFMGDQGFLNYYMARFRPDVEMHWLRDVHLWGGCADARQRPRSSSTAIEGSIVHWAGCRRPGPLPLEPFVPRLLTWQKFYYGACWNNRDFSGAVLDAAMHASRVFRDCGSVAKRWILRNHKPPAVAKSSSTLSA